MASSSHHETKHTPAAHDPKIVCVTGVSGFIASSIAVAFLRKGYYVRGTVRDLKNKSSYDFLEKIAASLGAKLTLFEADLMVPGSFEQAIQGCTYVVHSASPFRETSKDPQHELIDPAVHGTENVLTTVAHTSSVKRVVMTSSLAAVYGNVDQKPEGETYTEKDWNSTSTLKDSPYSLSKMLSEKRAWELVKDQSFTLVTILPGFVLGPSLTPRDDSESIGFMQGMMNGSMRMGVPESYYPMVDVRDVADAHVAAIENPDASGRYICAKEVVAVLDAAHMLKETYPDYSLPTFTLPKVASYVGAPISGRTWHFVRHNVGKTIKIDNSRIRNELKIEFPRPFKQTLVDMAERMMDYGLIERKGAPVSSKDAAQAGTAEGGALGAEGESSSAAQGESSKDSALPEPGKGGDTTRDSALPPPNNSDSALPEPSKGGDASKDSALPVPDKGSKDSALPEPTKDTGATKDSALPDPAKGEREPEISSKPLNPSSSVPTK